MTVGWEAAANKSSCSPAGWGAGAVPQGVARAPSRMLCSKRVDVLQISIWLLQEEVLERCRGVWPERFRHGYAHFAGPMIEEFFFKCAQSLMVHKFSGSWHPRSWSSEGFGKPRLACATAGRSLAVVHKLIPSRDVSGPQQVVGRAKPAAPTAAPAGRLSCAICNPYTPCQRVSWSQTGGGAGRSRRCRRRTCPSAGPPTSSEPPACSPST